MVLRQCELGLSEKVDTERNMTTFCLIRCSHYHISVLYSSIVSRVVIKTMTIIFSSLRCQRYNLEDMDEIVWCRTIANTTDRVQGVWFIWHTGYVRSDYSIRLELEYHNRAARDFKSVLNRHSSEDFIMTVICPSWYKEITSFDQYVPRFSNETHTTCMFPRDT